MSVWRNKIRYVLKILVGICAVIMMVSFILDITSNQPNGLSMEVQDMDREGNTNSEFPQLLHQIWNNYSAMPSAWSKAITTCKTRNPQMQYILWNSSKIEDFLHKDYPWFLDTYKGYYYDIQRVDAARYFILHKYGGVYMDMDIKCRSSFLNIFHSENLTKYDCILPETKPFGVSNDLLVAKPHSAFFGHVIMRLIPSNHWYILPYMTVMLSSGPGFLTNCIWTFNSEKNSVYFLPQDLYTKKYFSHIHGSSWHQWDGVLIVKLYSFINNNKLITCVGMIIGIIVLMTFCKRRKCFVKI